MKINFKDKRVVGAIAGLVVTVSTIGGFKFWSYGQINEIENDYTSVESDISFTKNQIIERNESILEYKDDLSKYISNKKLLDNIDDKTKDIKELSEFIQDESETNEVIDMLNDVNEDVDKLLIELDKNKDIDKDSKVKNIKDTIKSLDYGIDDDVKRFNGGPVNSYNERLEKFPGNKYAQKNNVSKVKLLKN